MLFSIEDEIVRQKWINHLRERAKKYHFATVFDKIILGYQKEFQEKRRTLARENHQKTGDPFWINYDGKINENKFCDDDISTEALKDTRVLKKIITAETLKTVR